MQHKLAATDDACSTRTCSSTFITSFDCVPRKNPQVVAWYSGKFVKLGERVLRVLRVQPSPLVVQLYGTAVLQL